MELLSTLGFSLALADEEHQKTRELSHTLFPCENHIQVQTCA